MGKFCNSCGTKNKRGRNFSFLSEILGGEGKRKRLANTTNEQYEEYLSFMENDYIFRTGTINSTSEDDYIEKKWNELAHSLNSMGNGPILSPEVWRKRFTDWKNTTRSKQRKLLAYYKTEGASANSTLKLTPLEERGLKVWGKVEMTGSNKISITCEPTPVPAEPVPSTSQEFCMPILFSNEEHVIKMPQSPVTLDNSNSSSKTVPTPKYRRPARIKKNGALNKLTSALLRTYKESVNSSAELNQTLKHLGDIYQETENKKLEMQYVKLQFEIAKYKYEHRDFIFQ